VRPTVRPTDRPTGRPTGRIWWNGGWRTLIGVTALTGYTIGGTYYYPQDYVSVAQPACTGYTDDGCALRWQDVSTNDGSTIPQCVQFCPRDRTAAPPPEAAAPAEARPGSCEVDVFVDLDLAGDNFRTTEDQPSLGNWDKVIRSINVISGTWDFFTESDYGGDSMRLTPGTYRDLGDNWQDQIGSFHCVQ
jgi:Beta/Gamma crystallin